MQRPVLRIFQAALAIVVAFALSACGGSDGGPIKPVTAPPVITSQPQAATVDEGSTATFSVAATGTAPLTYQWLRGGTAIAGATEASYTTPPTAASDTLASFTVAVTSGADSVTSDAAVLTVTPLAQGTLTGRVQSSVDGAPITAAVVRIGAAQAVTAADGTFSIEAPASVRVVVNVEATGFAPTTRVAAVTGGGTAAITAQLIPIGATQTVTVSAGGDVVVGGGSPALLRLPPAALVRTDGGVAASDVLVSLTPINPAVDANLMPGDFSAANGATTQPIESFGALRIDIADSTGAKYNLASGSTATIRIPLGTRSTTPPASVPLYYFDEATGLWSEEGTATLQGTTPDQYYEGSVAHFSTWNADQVAQTVTLTGCVHDTSDLPVVGALVVADGIDYSGNSRATTLADGSFTIAVKRSSRATVAALAGDKLTNTVSATPSDSNFALPSCLVTSLTTAGLKVTLTWGASPSDIDSHLLLPDAEEVYFSNKGTLLAPTYANLDVDDTSGFGPEVVTVTRLMQGTYRYLAYNYSGSFTPGVTASPARIELNRNGLINVFSPPAGEGVNRWWHVFDLVVDAQCGVTLVPVNAWLTASPGPVVNPNPVLCTPN